jgi:hypothetical protein
MSSRFSSRLSKPGAFTKMKALLRKADPRTIDPTWRTIGTLLDCFNPEEYANDFKNAG